MTAAKMHEGEIDINTSLVRRLLAEQFPQWADLPIEPVPSAGTDNALYRLGDDMAVRLPRVHWVTDDMEKEHYWLPRLAPFLPLKISKPIAKGQPGEGYPWEWSIYGWLEGESAALDRLEDPKQAAVDLAEFITALQKIDITDGPLAVDHGLRGRSLAVRDTRTREAIQTMEGMIDTQAATRVWEAALDAPEWDRAPVWFHGDLLPGNVLVARGRMNAIIDFSGLGVGDPACDMMIAWGLFTGESRDAFRAALEVDDATWTRGRGHALSQAVIFIPYYLNTNPVGVGYARRAIDEVLSDHKRAG